MFLQKWNGNCSWKELGLKKVHLKVYYVTILFIPMLLNELLFVVSKQDQDIQEDKCQKQQR
jgi:hypothetical protein